MCTWSPGGPTGMNGDQVTERKIKMLKRQEDKLTMYEAVRTYLEDHQDIYSGIPEFVQHRNEFLQLRNDLSGKENERMNAKKGKTDAKESTRESVSSLALAVSGALFAYSKKINDPELKTKSNYTLAAFKKIRDSELPITLNSIRDLASANISNLGTYGISADVMTDFESRIDKYQRALGSKESSGAVKTGAAKTLQSLFKATDDKLDSIDRLMENFRDTNAQFYKGYKSSRVVKAAGVRHRKDENVPEGNQTA